MFILREDGVKFFLLRAGKNLHTSFVCPCEGYAEIWIPIPLALFRETIHSRRQAISRPRLRKWFKKSYAPVMVERVSLTISMFSASLTSVAKGYFCLAGFSSWESFSATVTCFVMGHSGRALPSLAGHLHFF